jgi:hypothetical protein
MFQHEQHRLRVGAALVLLVLLSPLHAAAHATGVQPVLGRRLLQRPAVAFAPPPNMPPPITSSPTSSPTLAPSYPVIAELEVQDSEVGGHWEATLLTPLRTFLSQYTGLPFDQVRARPPRCSG